MERINELGKVAGSISAILALLALVFFNPIKQRIQHKREEHRKAKENTFFIEIINKKQRYYETFLPSITHLRHLLDGLSVY